MAVRVDPGLGSVGADRGQIEQVIANLVVNARDAMPDGGQVTIETRNVTLDAAYAATHPYAPPGPYVMLAVSDTGHGMDDETRSRVFEPFFTTKEPGKGTGLGLSTVYGIVKQSGGSVEVYSEPGRGTVFKVYLPRVGNEAEAESGARAAVEAPRGSETILVVEDEPLVREIAVAVLAEHGYTVHEAASGADALELARELEGPVDLVVTDVVMPGMSGRELAEALAAERPGVKVLFMSGYTEDAIVRRWVLDESVAFLAKPFTPAALAARVREVLDS